MISSIVMLILKHCKLILLLPDLTGPLSETICSKVKNTEVQKFTPALARKVVTCMELY